MSKEVGNRRYMKGQRDAFRLVSGVFHQRDVKMLSVLMEKSCHKGRAGAIRLALRHARAVSVNDPQATAMAKKVLAEAAWDSPERLNLARNSVRVPVHLEYQDNDIMEELKVRWGFGSFGQVLRFAVRYAAEQALQGLPQTDCP